MNCMNKAFFLRLLQSCNPNAYPDLTDEKLRSTLRHFFIQFAVLFVIMGLLFIPAYFIHADEIQETLGSFSEARLDGLFTSDAPIELVGSPKIVFDRNATAVKGQATIAAEGVFYRPWYWFGSEYISYENIKDAKSLDPRVVGLVAVFLLPALVFWSGIFILFKAFLFILLFSVLGWILAGAFKQSITYPRALQIAFYAALPLLVLEMLIFPFWHNSWVSLVVYVIFFVLGVALISERKIRK